MFVELEKQLINKGYKHVCDDSLVLSYGKNNLPDVYIEYYPFREKNLYKFSFPVSYGYNYSTYFNDVEDLQLYANEIIINYL